MKITILFKRFIDNPASILWYIIMIYYYFIWTNHLNLKDIRILSESETFDEIIKWHSFIRFWDWDSQIIMWMSNWWGRSIEKANPKLVKELKNIITNDSNILIWLFKYIIEPSDSELKKEKKFINYIPYRFFFWKKLNKGLKYWNWDIFRSSSKKTKFINYLKEKNIVIITKKNKNIEKIKLWKSVYNILVPEKYAYSNIDSIFTNFCKLKEDKFLTKNNTLVLISAWPTAKVLAQKIDNLWYQAIDTWAFFDDLYINNIL